MLFDFSSHPPYALQWGGQQVFKVVQVIKWCVNTVLTKIESTSSLIKILSRFQIQEKRYQIQNFNKIALITN